MSGEFSISLPSLIRDMAFFNCRDVNFQFEDDKFTIRVFPDWDESRKQYKLSIGSEDTKLFELLEHPGATAMLLMLSKNTPPEKQEVVVMNEGKKRELLQTLIRAVYERYKRARNA